MESVLLDPELIRMLCKFRPQVLERFNELDPEIYRSGEGFCCSSGCHPDNGIYGYGNTPERAIEEWNTCYQNAMSKL